MRNDVSSSITPPPLSLQECTVDGELDLLRYYIYRRRIKKKLLQSSSLQQFIKMKQLDGNNEVASIHKRKKIMARNDLSRNEN